MILSCFNKNEGPPFPIIQMKILIIYHWIISKGNVKIVIGMPMAIVWYEWECLSGRVWWEWEYHLRRVLWEWECHRDGFGGNGNVTSEGFGGNSSCMTE